MLRVHTRKLGNIAVLSLQGQIVNGETQFLRNAVESLSEVSAVKLDFARVTMVDAGGLGAMLELRTHAESKGLRFELINLSKQIARIFEITRLDTVFRITGGVEFLSSVPRGRRASFPSLASCA